MNAVRHQNLRFSNFLITISTNVVPKDDGEMDSLSEWLVEQTELLFHQWHVLNGTVLKPAGSDNRDGYGFPDPIQIISVRSRISIEQGDVAQRGQVHAHVLVEVAHTYTGAVEGNQGTGEDDKPVIGVHTNVYQIRERLNSSIHRMDIEPGRRPPKIYVNSRLLTRGSDNSNKWLTLQYINKDVAKPDVHTDGVQRDLRADEEAATPEDREAARGLRQAGTHEVEPGGASPPQWRLDQNLGVGGAISPANSPQGSPRIQSQGHRIPNPQHPHVHPAPPSVVYTTSTANIGLPRHTRGRVPKKYT